MKNSIYKIASFCLAAFLIGCQNDDEFSHDPSSPIVIESFIPAQGGGGVEVLINGSNFSGDTSSITVTLNGRRMPVVGANGNQMMVVVPKKVGSGRLVVTIGDQTVETSTDFTYVYTRTVSTFAGSGTAGYLNGQGTDAAFNFGGMRCGLTVDNDLNVYVADGGNHCIRKITPDGTVSTLAGNPNSGGYADGTGSDAKFQTPYDVGVDAEGNVYSVDPWNWDIRKITPEGVATTMAWGDGAPYCIGVDPVNGDVYYTAHDVGKIKRITQGGDHTTVIEGLTWPSDIAVDDQHNLWIVLHDNGLIAKFDAGTWNRTVIAGEDGVYGYQDGIGNAARFYSPWGIAIDQNYNLYIAGNGTGDANSSSPDQSIRYIETATATVSTFAGSGSAGYSDAIGSAAAFNAPTGVAVDKNGVVYVLDRKNNRIRKIITE
jgi:hypothetical protein